MIKRNKELIGILEEIGEVQTKRRKDRHKEASLLPSVEDMEKLFSQYGLVEKTPEESEQKKLSKSEVKMLMEACSMMRNETVETLDICIALNALIISIISVIVSATAMAASMTNSDTQPFSVLAVCVLAVVIIVAEIILYCMAKKRSSANAKKADRYRDACLMLLALSEEEAERVNES